jgi:hypothetical protein
VGHASALAGLIHLPVLRIDEKFAENRRGDKVFHVLVRYPAARRPRCLANIYMYIYTLILSLSSLSLSLSLSLSQTHLIDNTGT